MKVVVNRCFGGFGLSDKAVERYGELIGKKINCYTDSNDGKYYKSKDGGKLLNHFLFSDKDVVSRKEADGLYFSCYDLKRDDPVLVQVVEELGEEANSWASALEVVEIPDDVDWKIDDYDGQESIHEKHRSW